MKTLFIILLLTGFNCKSQLEVNDTLILTGQSNSSRILDGLSSSDAIDAAVDAKSIVESRLIYANVSNSSANQIDLTLTPTISQYSIGLRINFFSPITANDSVLISIDGLNHVALLHNDGRSIDSLEIVSGMVVSAIYDGTNFLVLSQTAKLCPTGFLSVNDYFCIEQDENSVATFWDANVDCGDRNARLCSWSEWYLACVKLGGNLTNMTNNQEYVDSSQNYSNSISSSCWAKQVGDGGCQENERSDPYNLRSYRCCINK